MCKCVKMSEPSLHINETILNVIISIPMRKYIKNNFVIMYKNSSKYNIVFSINELDFKLISCKKFACSEGEVTYHCDKHV